MPVARTRMRNVTNRARMGTGHDAGTRRGDGRVYGTLTRVSGREPVIRNYGKNGVL
jgi:hypothetical protein